MAPKKVQARTREKRLNIRATEEERKRWQAKAEKSGRSLSQLARYLLENYAERAN